MHNAHIKHPENLRFQYPANPQGEIHMQSQGIKKRLRATSIDNIDPIFILYEPIPKSSQMIKDIGEVIQAHHSIWATSLITETKFLRPIPQKQSIHRQAPVDW